MSAHHVVTFALASRQATTILESSPGQAAIASGSFNATGTRLLDALSANLQTLSANTTTLANEINVAVRMGETKCRWRQTFASDGLRCCLLIVTPHHVLLKRVDNLQHLLPLPLLLLLLLLLPEVVCRCLITANSEARHAEAGICGAHLPQTFGRLYQEAKQVLCCEWTGDVHGAATAAFHTPVFLLERRPVVPYGMRRCFACKQMSE